MLFRYSYSPRWLIFLIDLFLVSFSILSAYFLRFNFTIDPQYIPTLKWTLPLVIGIRALSFFTAKTYSGIIRYTGAKDTERIFIVTSAGSLIIMFINLSSYLWNNSVFLIPLSIVIIDFVQALFFLISFRFFVKSFYNSLNTSKTNKKNIIIFGSGELGLITKRALDKDTETGYNTLAFIDTDDKLYKQKIENISIYPPEKLEELIQKNSISTLIFAKEDIPVKVKNRISQFCLQHQIGIKNIPKVNDWINGELSSKQIRQIKIEELLQREAIVLNKENIKKELCDNTILVTGAAGSIGSEIVHQLTRFNPRQIILFDQAESPLYDLELKLTEEYHYFNAKIIIGDITDKKKLEVIFKTYQPQMVYHAAAYKHVPMMENHPYEAIKTNVMGTQNIADLSVLYKVKKFVFISTDKAVNPTNVMGASKRIAEIYIQSLNATTETQFVTTRFGNVLGSNGSVIPRFRKQIESGGPVTITHPEVTRFFMTIPEACQLVLEAGASGNGGEIFVFDMGESVKILDLAKNMIHLSGLKLGTDIQIQYTGLRPGEKLYEELLNNAENTIPTHHSKILKAKVRTYAFNEIQDNINDLLNIQKNFDNKSLVKKMKEIVPEFISKNSIYESLDH